MKISGDPAWQTGQWNTSHACLHSTIMFTRFTTQFLWKPSKNIYWESTTICLQFLQFST